MDQSRDFMQWLGQDMSLKILMCFEDPSDLARISAVSSSWRQFVIANALSKKLCLRMFPEASTFDCVIEIKDKVETVTKDSVEWAYLEKEHRVYASLHRSLMSCTRENCILDSICASSTDNYPDESIRNTLDPNDRIGTRPLYWSSKGESNPSSPETLFYKLASQLCLVTEFHVHPFEAYFQYGFPIYSAKAVRFHIGYRKGPLDVNRGESDKFVDCIEDLLDERFVWTYSSPEFPMAQENCLQKFKLLEPILCIGGILRVDLLGRVQTQEMDGLYYICINHVQVIGGLLSPVFDVAVNNGGGNCCVLKYHPKKNCCSSDAEIMEA